MPPLQPWDRCAQGQVGIDTREQGGERVQPFNVANDVQRWSFSEQLRLGCTRGPDEISLVLTVTLRGSNI